MAIEIVTFPSYKMVDLSIVFLLTFTISGKPPFSYGFPMVFPAINVHVHHMFVGFSWIFMGFP